MSVLELLPLVLANVVVVCLGAAALCFGVVAVSVLSCFCFGSKAVAVSIL